MEVITCDGCGSPEGIVAVGIAQFCRKCILEIWTPSLPQTQRRLDQPGPSEVHRVPAGGRTYRVPRDLALAAEVRAIAVRKRSGKVVHWTDVVRTLLAMTLLPARPCILAESDRCTGLYSLKGDENGIAPPLEGCGDSVVEAATPESKERGNVRSCDA
jgi:hypothetical protein